MNKLWMLLNPTAAAAALGVSYVLWSFASSGEKRTQKSLPESNPVRMKESRQMNALVMNALKEAAQTNDNLARGAGK